MQTEACNQISAVTNNISDNRKQVDQSSLSHTRTVGCVTVCNFLLVFLFECVVLTEMHRAIKTERDRERERERDLLANWQGTVSDSY